MEYVQSQDVQSHEHENQPSDEPRIAWHAAFVEAIQMELEQYRDMLEFKPEYPLTAEPLKIDVVIIKKTSNVLIHKNIAAIFRKHNILEFKSPTDYLSLNDFYKVYGYACLYASLEHIPITDLTLTLIESRRPREVLAHLREIRSYTVEERGAGIYTVRGDIIPIQIIDSRELSEGENLWLRNLDNELNAEGIRRITGEIARAGKEVRIQAYVDAIVRANVGVIEEAIRMSDVTLEQVLERTGLIAKWEARYKAEAAMAEERGKREVAKNLINIGLPLEQVAQVTGLDIETLT
ncbi:MAG: hypothetical protein LBL64_02030 [Treponema sp.]|jgi:hypothetical protein|nr:hypothetical protein [Treponema sp.]